MPVSCPACSDALVPVEAAGHYGARMIVTTCSGCRGLWLKAGDPVAVGHESIIALEGDADLGGITTQPRADFRACPDCRTALEEMIGGLIPAGLHIDTCRQCHGMWFDRGELLVYKSALEEKRKKASQQERDRMKKRTARQRALEPSPGMRFLSARIYPGMGLGGGNIGDLLDLL